MICNHQDRVSDWFEELVLTEFVEEILTTEDYYDSQLEKFKRNGSPKKDVKKYYSSDLFLEKIELDEEY